MPLANPIPYGLRDVKLIPYLTPAATAFGTVLTDLPNAQVFEFNEEEDYDDLRGDDHLVTSHGQGAQVAWTLGSGGISFAAYAVLAGGTIVTTGTTPSQVTTYRKSGYDIRPFFTALGQSISDSGGDMHAVVYLCRSTGNLEGKFEDTNFFIPGASGTGYPCRVTGTVATLPIDNAVYDFIQHETAAAITAPVTA